MFQPFPVMLKLVYLSLLQRILSVSGVADAVHIAVYYIGTILLEYQERAGHNGAGSGAYRQQGGSSSSHSHAGVGAPRQPSVIAPGPGSAVQQFWIPDELVGSSESRAFVFVFYAAGPSG
jgi:poly(rC)-binding protein 2/3/4